MSEQEPRTNPEMMQPSSSEEEDDFTDLKAGTPSVESAPATPEANKEHVSDKEVTRAGSQQAKELQKAALERIKIAETKHAEDLKNLSNEGGKFAKFPEIQALMKKQLEKTINEYQTKAGALQEAVNNDKDLFSEDEELPKPAGPRTEVDGAPPPGKPVLADEEYRQDRTEDLEKVAQADTLADDLAKEFQAFQEKYGEMELGVTEMRAGRIPAEKLMASTEQASYDDSQEGVGFASPIALDREIKHWDVAGKAFGIPTSENVIVKDGAVRRLNEQPLTEAEMRERAAELESIIARGNELRKLSVDVVSAEEGANINENIIHPEVKKAVQNTEAKIQNILVRAQKDLDSFAYQEQDILPEEGDTVVSSEPITSEDVAPTELNAPTDQTEVDSVFTNEKFQPELSLQEVDDMDMSLQDLERLVKSDISAIGEPAIREAFLQDSLQSLERIAEKQNRLPAEVPMQERSLLQKRIEMLRVKLKSPNDVTQVRAKHIA